MKAKLIRCPAPLPETTPDPVLTKMLEAAPLEEGEGGNRKAPSPAKGPRGKGGTETPPPRGGGKRTASEDPEVKASKQGKKSSPEGPAPGGAPATLFPQGNQPSSEP